MDRKDLLALANQIADLERRLSLDGPQTDDELHHWIKHNLGFTIPRNSVCEGHASPFSFIADLYFNRKGSALLMANRGGNKTHGVAILHLLNMLYKPGIEAATVGAIEAQADRAYSHFRTLVQIYQDRTGQDVVDTSMKSKTRLKNRSQLEILPGTKNAVNGPHPQVVHVDEVELMDPEVYQESRNMALGKTKEGGVHFRAQDIITSTRKRGVGPMQELIDSVNEAKLMGAEPPYEMYSWCIFECAEPMPSCQVARPDLPDCDKCDCDKVVSGRWDNGQPRTLKDVCGGRFAKSDGWVDHETIKNTFTKASQGIWEAQQECIKPSTEGLVMPQFSLERHGVRRYDPDPDHGPIFMSIDFGGTNPHAVNWYQVLKYEIEVETYNGTTKRLREGTRVCFDEIYKAEVSNTQIAELIVRKEELWRQKHPRWRVSKRFADPQGKAARLDLARYRVPLPTANLTTRDVKEHVKICAYLIENDTFQVDVERCEMFCAEIESWHYPKKKPGMLDDPDIPVDDFDHCMSNWRYAMANIEKMHMGGRRRNTTPGSTGIVHATVKGSGTKRQGEAPVAYSTNSSTLPSGSKWRLRFAGVQPPTRN
jgi:hypothetical protein